jgi:hypothetical protein
MRRRVLPSPAFCLALLALFVSLGGTTYALTALPRDSVGTDQIRDRAVTENELANSAVITRKLANGAVTQRKIAPGAITGSRIAPDSLGGAQIDESSLSAVPLATDAERAKTAIRAQVAETVERVARADTAAAADRAELADEAGHADQAERADVADALAAVDTNFEPVSVPEGDFAFFTLDCDSAEYVPVNGGFFPTDDLDDLPAVSGSAPAGGGWLLIVSDLDADAGPDDDTPGLAFVVCVKAKAAT